MKAIELFAGAGGSALGLRDAGVHVIAHIEQDADACATLRAAGFAPWEGDVRDFAFDLHGGVDLLWASPPCQPFSMAGKRDGEDDERNGWRWTLDAIDASRPTRVICENVPGLLMHRKGHGTPCPGCYWERDVLPAFRARFAAVQVQTLDAADYGVPQHRRRVFLMAGPTPIRWPDPTHGKPGLRGLFGELLPWVGFGDALGLDGTLDHGRNSAAHPTQERVTTSAEPAPTVTTIGNLMFNPRGSRQGRRHLTLCQSAVLQDFPLSHPFAGNLTSQKRQVGNGVPPTMARLLALAVAGADATTTAHREAAK